jgi:hypothetical protein
MFIIQLIKHTGEVVKMEEDIEGLTRKVMEVL